MDWIGRIGQTTSKESRPVSKITERRQNHSGPWRVKPRSLKSGFPGGWSLQRECRISRIAFPGSWELLLSLASLDDSLKTMIKWVKRRGSPNPRGDLWQMAHLARGERESVEKALVEQ